MMRVAVSIAAMVAALVPPSLAGHAESTVAAGPLEGTIQYAQYQGIPVLSSGCNYSSWTLSATHAGLVVNLVSSEYAGAVTLTGQGNGYCSFTDSEMGSVWMQAAAAPGAVGVLQCNGFSGTYTRTALQMDVDVTGWCAVDYQASGLVELHLQLALLPSQVSNGQVSQAAITGTTASYTASATPVVIAGTSSSPVTAGGWVDFDLSWLNPNLNTAIHAVICRTAAIDRAGNCLGGAWAVGPAGYPAVEGNAYASYRTGSGDIGSQSYFGFACDGNEICSPPYPGSFVVTANSAPVITSSTASPNPVVEGGWITFTIGATDPDGDPVEYVVCKTNQVDSWNITCPGGAWAGPGYYVDHQATHAEIASSPNQYYAFACDTSGACSSSVAGTFVVAANGPPTITATSASPDPAVAGTHHTFTVDWTDPNMNQGDQWSVSICTTPNHTTSQCTDGTYTGSYLTDKSPIQMYSGVTPADVGTHTYWAFVCDNAGTCSTASGTFTVSPNNYTPVITAATVSPNPVVSGQQVTFSVGWYDGDTGDIEDLVVCKTPQIDAYGNCLGGWWAYYWQSSVSPINATYTTTVNDTGTRSWYAFVCDSVDHCSGSWSGTFTVV
jgi:hypothetical protein